MTLDLEPIEPIVKLDLEPIEGVDPVEPDPTGWRTPAPNAGRIPLSQTPYPAKIEDVGISGGEFEGVKPVELPPFGEPGTFTRGISKGLTGAVQFATSTPGVAMAPALMIPGVGAAIGTGMSALALWEAAQKAQEAIEKKSPEAAGEAVFMGGLGALGARASVKGITESARLISPESAKILPKATAEVVKEATGETSVVQAKPVVEPPSPETLTPPVVTPGPPKSSETALKVPQEGAVRTRQSIASKILKLFGVHDELADRFGNWAASKIQEPGLEGFREGVLKLFEDAGMQSERQISMFRTEPSYYEAMGFTPEQVAEHVRNAEYANQKAVRDVRAQNSKRMEDLEALAPGGEPAETPIPKPTASPVIHPGIDPSFQPGALATEASKTVGLTPPMVAPLDIGQKLGNTIRKWFTVRGHLPEEIHQEAVKMENLKTASDFRIKMMERDLMGALKEVYGLSGLQVAGGGSRRIPAAAIQLMDDYLHNRVANPARIPTPVRSVLDTMRSEMDAQSSQIITELTRQANQLPGKSPKAVSLHNLINKIKDNMGIYVHRAYKYFDSSEGAADWYKNLNAGIKIKAEDYLMQNGPPGMTQAEAQSRILDWLSDLKGDSAFTGGGTLGAKDLSIFMKRGVIAPELRAVLGEYHNPLVNYAKSMSKMADWVAKQRFLNEVKRLGMGRFLFEQGVNPPGFNTEIAGKASDVLSPLNGLRTSEEIAGAFHDLGASPNPGLLAKTYLTLNAFSKFAATGLSMLTQVRNLASRPFMALMAGHAQLGKFGRSVKAISQDFAGNDATWKTYLTRLYELGVLGDTARAGELRAIIKDAALRDIEPNALFHWSLGKAIQKYGYKIPAEIYRLSDELGNVFGFENEKAIQSKVHPTWTPDQIEAEAAKITRDLYPVYSESPRGVKAFRRVAIVGPFVTFPYQMYRTVFNGMARTIHELRSANPVERTVGAKRLAGQMTAIAGTAALAEVGKAMLGINQKQEEDFRRFQPSWSKNSKWLFTAKDDKGKLSAVNLSYLDPYSYITDPVNAIISSVRTGSPIQETVLETMKEALRPWISPQMLAQALSEAYQGKTESGREIWNKTDPGVDIATKSVQHVASVLKPGTLQRIERRIIPAIRNEQPLYGRKLEPGPEIARELTGMAIEQFDFRNGLAYRARTFTDLDKEAEGLFHRTVSQTQTTTPSDLLKSYQESDQRRFGIWQEMRKDFLAAVRQGVTVEEARKLMQARGMSRADVMAISNGKYIPMPISNQTRKRAQERKRVLPMPELNAYRQQAFKRSLD